MKIAVTHDNGTVFGHFGHTEQFKVYEVEDGKVVCSKVVDTCGSGHGALATFLADLGCDVLICGGIGGGAQIAIADAGIELRGGVSGSCDEAVAAYLKGKLNYDPEAKCTHHHEEGHECHGHHDDKDGHSCHHDHHDHGNGHTCHCHDH